MCLSTSVCLHRNCELSFINYTCRFHCDFTTWSDTDATHRGSKNVRIGNYYTFCGIDRSSWTIDGLNGATNENWVVLWQRSRKLQASFHSYHKIWWFNHLVSGCEIKYGPSIRCCIRQNGDISLWIHAYWAFIRNGKYPITICFDRTIWIVRCGCSIYSGESLSFISWVGWLQRALSNVTITVVSHELFFTYIVYLFFRTVGKNSSPPKWCGSVSDIYA